MEADSTHPVPCVFGERRRSPLSHSVRSPSAKRSSDDDPPRCPPLTSTDRAPRSRMARAARSMSARISTSNPARPAASGRFGVTRVASGTMRLRNASTASSRSNASPCFDTKTGSTTTFGTPASSIASATASTISAVESIPVLAASTPRSVATARICAPTTSAGTSETPVTPLVFCTVIEVMALIPHTPSTANVLRSAWIPAPPPESDPAMVSARGTWSITEVVPASRLEDALGPVRPNADQTTALADLPDVRELRAEPLRKPGGGRRHRIGWQRGQQLVVLPALQGEREGIDIGEHVGQLFQGQRHRNVSQAHGCRHSAGLAEASQILGQAVGHVHHGRGLTVGERLALAHPRHRPKMGINQASSPVGGDGLGHVVGRRLKELQSAGGGPEGSGHHQPVPGPGPRPRQCCSPGHFPGDRDGDDQLLCPGRVPPNHCHGLLPGRVANPAVQLDHPGSLDVSGACQRHEAVARAASHGRHVAHVDGECLVAEVRGGHGTPLEVHSLDEHVGGEDAEVRAHLDEGCIVSQAKGHSRRVLGKEAPDDLDQLVFGEAGHAVAPPSMPRCYLRDFASTCALTIMLERTRAGPDGQQEGAAMPVINTIELEGVSDKSWGEAAREALREATKTIRNINRLEVLETGTTVKDGRIVEYRTHVRLYFRVEQDR